MVICLVGYEGKKGIFHGAREAFSFDLESKPPFLILQKNYWKKT
jgi:hypothetical protein